MYNLQTDNGHEYVLTGFNEFCVQHKQLMVLSSFSIQFLWKQYGLCCFKHNSQSHVGERILLLLIMCKIVYQRKLFDNVQFSIWNIEQHIPSLGI
jgi:hypothetical protein